MLQKIFDNDLVAIHISKVILTLKKPAYVGMCTCYLSRVLMYKFHYDYIKNNNSTLLCTSTDSMMYEIKTEDIYEDFNKNKKMFDFSNDSAESN